MNIPDTKLADQPVARNLKDLLAENVKATPQEPVVKTEKPKKEPVPDTAWAVVLPGGRSYRFAGPKMSKSEARAKAKEFWKLDRLPPKTEVFRVETAESVKETESCSG